MKKAKVGILGGGFAGLLIGQELKKRQVDFLLIEKEEEVGGLARTVQFEKISGEFGPHALYSKDSKVMDFFKSLPIDYIQHNRKVRICHRGSDGKIYELNYPFENGLGQLPLQDRLDCLMGYIECFHKKKKNYKSLKDWIHNGLGYGIAKHFMIPYNEKIWNVSLDQMSIGSIMKKIDPSPIEDLVKSCIGIETTGRAYQSVFLYPKKGTGEISRVMSEEFKDQIDCCNTIKKIDFSKQGTVVETSEETYQFDTVISTLPIPEMLKMQNLKSLKSLSKHFKSNNTYFIAVVLKERKQFKRFADCHWVFFSGKELFYRINVMQAYLKELRPSLMAEVTVKGAIKKMTIKEIEAEVIKGLLADGLIDSAKDIEVVSTKYVPYTYPIPTKGLPKIKDKIKKRLAKYNTFLFGRNGNWDYMNMDQLVLSSWDLMTELTAQGKLPKN